MKCPHCGIYYMDGERECPVCGKSAGPFAPKKKKAYRPNVPDRPARPASARPKKVQHTSSGNAAWQQTAAQKGGTSGSSSGSGCAAGCLTVVIILAVLVALSIVGGLVSYSALPDFGSAGGYLEHILDDDTFETCDVTDVLPAGSTWRSSDGSLTITVREDGSVEWTDGADTAEDDAPLMERLAVDEDNMDDYYDEEDAARWPLDRFTRFDLSCTDDAGDMDDLTIWFYIPNDTEPDDLTAIEAYNWDVDAYLTFSRTNSPQEPAAQPA